MSKSLFSNGKRGNAIIDTVFIVVILLVIGLSALFGNLFLQDVNTEIQNSELSNQTKTSSQNLATNYPSWLDNLFFIAFVLLWIVAVILSYMIDTTPVFLVVVLVLLVFVLLISGFMSNTYQEIANDGNLTPSVFPKMDYILDHLLMFTLFIGFTIAAALYGKNYLNG